MFTNTNYVAPSMIHMCYIITGELANFTVCYSNSNVVKNTTFDCNFVTFSLNVSNVDVLINNMGIDKLHELGCCGKYFGVKL